MVPGLGLITVGRSVKECDISADIYVQTVPVILNCVALTENFRPVTESEMFDVEYWEEIHLHNHLLCPKRNSRFHLQLVSRRPVNQTQRARLEHRSS